MLLFTTEQKRITLLEKNISDKVNSFILSAWHTFWIITETVNDLPLENYNSQRDISGPDFALIASLHIFWQNVLQKVLINPN